MATFGVQEPATGRTIQEVPILDAEAVAALAAEARAAQPAWAAKTFKERGKVFREARRWLMANDGRMRDTICAETGKTYEDAQLEITVAAQSFGYWARNAGRHLGDHKWRSTAPLVLGRRVIVRYEPVGIVGVIGPWNYPLVNAFCDCVPALMAGNAAILKPSRVTPLTALVVDEMMRDCGMPPGVFSVATGTGGETGEAVIDESDFVMFTGGTPTGRRVMERAAQTLTPVSLELGGKDPMIVCADADVEKAANSAAFSALCNGGQVCISIERVYVEAPVYQDFVTRLTEIVKGLRQGPPGGPGEVEVGAITDPKQAEVIDAHVRDAVEKGATAVTGGKPGADGRFYEPTVLIDVDHGMECMTEETFGPTIPVMRVSDVDEAVRLANDSPFGLQGSVFTKSLRKGEAIARRLECGAVCVNDALANYTVFDAPMGGWKTSGVGSRHGASGIRKYCKTQTIVLKGIAPKRELHHFPYTERTSRLMAAAVRRLYGR